MKIFVEPGAPAPPMRANPLGDLTDQKRVVSGDIWWLVFVGVATALLCAPFLRTVYAVSDEGILLIGADRILRGERIYGDFFAYLPPGGFVMMAAWFGIAGISMLSARVFAILIILGIACFTYMTCRRVSRNAAGSAILTLGWVVMSQGVGTQVTHHWITSILAMICAWASIASITDPQRWLRWPLIAGLAGGTAGMVTSTRGALAVLASLATFLSGPQYKAKSGAFVLATALIPIVLLVYVIWLGALRAAFDDVIVFDATRYVGVQAVPFAWGARQQNLPLELLFPFAALLALLTFSRDWRTALHDRIFRSCIAFGIAGVVGCYPRPDIVHVAFAAPMALPLVAYCMQRLTQSWQPIYRYVAAAMMIGSCLPATRAFSWAAQNSLHLTTVPTPRGNLALSVDGARALMARVASTPPGAAYFFYPVEELLQFLTARGQVGPIDRLVPGYNTPAQYQDACIAMMRSAQWVVVASLDSAGWKAMYPAMQDPAPKERVQFEHILTSAFAFVERDGWFELRRRVPGLDESACSSITH
jgi:hypothetical protein